MTRTIERLVVAALNIAECGRAVVRAGRVVRPFRLVGKCSLETGEGVREDHGAVGQSRRGYRPILAYPGVARGKGDRCVVGRRARLVVQAEAVGRGDYVLAADRP